MGKTKGCWGNCVDLNWVWTDIEKEGLRVNGKD